MDFRTAGLIAGTVIVFASGSVLTRRGAPYAAGLVTVHKLAALGAVVLLVLRVLGRESTPALTSGGWALRTAALILAVVLFASGAVLTRPRAAGRGLLWLHRLSSPAALAAGISLLLQLA